LELIEIRDEASRSAITLKSEACTVDEADTTDMVDDEEEAPAAAAAAVCGCGKAGCWWWWWWL
jgi:hypothetical protein